MIACTLPFPEKGDLGITKNYKRRTLTAIFAKVYNTLFLNCIQHEVKKILRKNQNGFQGNRSTSLRFWLSIKSSKSMCKKSQGNTIVCCFFHKQKKYRTNITNIWSHQKNYHLYNDALQKHKSNGFFTHWWYWCLQHCPWSLARWYISTIYVYNLPRLWTMNINRSNKSKWFHIKKDKKQTTSHRNDNRCRLCRRSRA